MSSFSSLKFQKPDKMKKIVTPLIFNRFYTLFFVFNKIKMLSFLNIHILLLFINKASQTGPYIPYGTYI